ncbi:hypothetical protein GCM10027194_10380 [Thalassiella azotivora]
MHYVDADPDWSVWVDAPGPDLPDEAPVDVRAWATRTAEAVLADAGDAPDAELRERLVRLLELTGSPGYPAGDEWVAKWLHLPSPDAVPLPLVLELHVAEDGDDEAGTLRRLVGADGGARTVEPPVVEEVSTPLGPGLRALAYGQSGAGVDERLTALLSYAWATRLDDVDVYVRLWAAGDPTVVAAAGLDVDALAATLEVRQA